MNKLLIAPTIALAINLNQGHLIKQEYEIKNDNEIKKTMELEGENEKYELVLKDILERKPIKELQEEQVVQTKKYIVNTNNEDEILNKYSTIEYDGEVEKETLNAKRIISIKESNYHEKYWETTKSTRRTIEVNTNIVSELPINDLIYEVNGENYQLVFGEFTPIQFEDNKPTKWQLNGEWVAIIPNYETIPIEWEVEVEYSGNVTKENVIAENIVAEYEVTEVIKSREYGKYIAPIGGIIAIIGFLLSSNLIVYSKGKRLKGYRKKGKEKIELDLTKLFKIDSELKVVIKKSLAKKMNNTHLIIWNDKNVVYENILNFTDEDIEINL